MASETLLTGSLSGEASTDLSALRFRFVVYNTSRQLALAGAGVLADGVLQDDPDLQGRAGAVMPLNGSILKVEAGGSVSIGDDVTPDANGRAVTSATTNEINGKALSAASAAGEFIEVLANYRGTTP